MRWRFQDSEALEGAEQMARDVGLLDRARETGEAVLRVYAWSRATLSFGRHESVRFRFAPEALREAGVDAVRRPTGGRVLMHDREVTYSVTAPQQDDLPLRESYGRVNAMLLEALALLGVHASEAPAGEALRPGDRSGLTCFSAPAGGELIVGGRKLVGSAQVRERGALLQHGSILIDDDQPRIAALASSPLALPLPAATLRGSLGRAPSYAEVRSALVSALVAREPAAESLGDAETARYAAPHRARFASAEWTWRR